MRTFTGRLAARALAAGVLALHALPDAAAAEPRGTLLVRVLPAHYVVGEQRFADARALEAHVRPLGARTVTLDDCTSGRPPARLLAAVEKLHPLSQGLEIRALGASDPGCVYAYGAVRRGASSAPLPLDAGHLAVDRRGRSILP